MGGVVVWIAESCRTCGFPGILCVGMPALLSRAQRHHGCARLLDVLNVPACPGPRLPPAGPKQSTGEAWDKAKQHLLLAPVPFPAPDAPPHVLHRTKQHTARPGLKGRQHLLLTPATFPAFGPPPPHTHPHPHTGPSKTRVRPGTRPRSAPTTSGARAGTPPRAPSRWGVGRQWHGQSTSLACAG